MLQATTELRFLRGVGPQRAAKLREQHLDTVEDLLYHLPFRYEDRRSFAKLAELGPGSGDRTLEVRVVSSRLIRTRRRGFTIFEAVVADASGSLKAVWFNQPYLARHVTAGRRAVLFGRPRAGRGRDVVLENPDYEILDEDDALGVHTGRIVPVYRKVGDCGSRLLRMLVHRALAELDPASLPDRVPAAAVTRHGLLGRAEALRQVHFPTAGTELAALGERSTPAQRSLAFEEAFLLQLGLLLRRRRNEQSERGIVYEIPDALRTRLGRMLPFKLTRAQLRVLREVGADLRSPHPMHRLLQGDVGSGKTIVALLTLLVAIENGYQGALMAPTEILAEQHFRNVTRVLEEGGLDCGTVLLTGSLRAGARRRALESIRSGQARLVVGTHALYEPEVTFRRLGLVVVDEQQRFGVLQRAALAEKGLRPDVLVMTATPIPRSLALTLYGDLDLSVIDELPPGRRPVGTVVRTEAERGRVEAGLRKELARGRQAYVVVPLVEETERSDLKAATVFADKLRREVFPGFRVGLVHGRMKGGQKDEVMRAFAAAEVDLLVATTVIEVGVDVPNATVMVVEHAERFGLSQLHQLRGRVGRGGERSWCVLMVSDDAHGREARQRLRVMQDTSDGFLIAQKDLELRGPGVVFGTQQHGLSDLRFLAEMLRAPELIEAARDAAAESLRASGEAGARALLESLGRRWRERLDLARVG
jgi:ATP-dependent DNA helicase RecG